MLANEYLVPTIGSDTAENGLPQFRFPIPISPLPYVLRLALHVIFFFAPPSVHVISFP